jgi:hypothetical protein
MYYAPPDEGFDLQVGMRSRDRIRLIVTDYSNGLPDIPGMTITPRPADTMPAMYDFADPTIVSKTVTLAR